MEYIEYDEIECDHVEPYVELNPGPTHGLFATLVGAQLLLRRVLGTKQAAKEQVEADEQGAQQQEYQYIAVVQKHLRGSPRSVARAVRVIPRRRWLSGRQI